MELKDFMKIALFSVIGFILMMIGSGASILAGEFKPYISHVFGTFLLSPVVFVICHKVHKRFTMYIFYLLIGIIYTVIGFWPMLLICIIVAFIAEIAIGKVENYSNNKRISIAFIIAEFVQSLHGFIFIFLIKQEAFARRFPNMIDPNRARFLDNFYFGTKNLFIVMAIQIVISFLGTRLGIYIYRKFFAKNNGLNSILK